MPPSIVGPTVIAINDGRNSQQAVKWAVDHLLKKNSSCTLIHVRTKPIHHHDVDVPRNGRPPTEDELHQLFLPFRGFCARKGIVATELVLHDIDIPSALTDYVTENSISHIVVGAYASPWSALIRRFNRDVDVPTSLAKSLPESCTLHVISKGKVQTIRPTGHPAPAPQIIQPQNVNVTPNTSMKDIVTLLQNAPLVHPNNFIANIHDSEDINRKPFKDAAIAPDSRNVWESLREMKDAMLMTSRKSNEDTNSPRGPRLSAGSSSSLNSSNRTTPNNSDSSGRLGLPLTDGNHEVHGNSSDSSKSNSSPKPLISLEAEIKKLKLELKKTTEQYGMACREAASAKLKATELQKFRQEKERNVEKAKLAQEAALALAEVERQKAKAAIEAAEVSQILAQMETVKRKQAEIRAKHEEEERRKALHEAVVNSIPYRRYDIKEIEAATNNFDDALKIGEGGYGPVFKGVLDHTVVAIKVVKPDLAHGERQFQQEVLVLSTIRHPHMVLLLGACPEFGCLVYEYMEYGSLEDRLFQKDDTPPIPWQARFKIASEIATGLLFLHQTKPEPLVHRDMKPANILLDRNYVSKISDVGLARLVPPSVANKTTQYRLTGAAGTFCYIDPEYQQTGLLGVKSDIYSLGVVLLQIITAKHPMGLSLLVEKAIQTGTFKEMLDPRVDWPIEETLSFARLALKCCELRKRDRPDLGTVILPELERISEMWDWEDSLTFTE
ncbi:UspA [Sesbania bispinosa]|nr:UspA [Sesbania bispinosa]